MASTPTTEPTTWTPPEADCDKCGAPASWAEESNLFTLPRFILTYVTSLAFQSHQDNADQAKYSWTKNLSWSDGAKFHTATYFASPRMWPLGYILGSQYSPLKLELDPQAPNINWRDRFEDLLALESGDQMISTVSRLKEAETASRIHNETVHDFVSLVNQSLQRNQDYVVLLEKLREISVRRKDSVTVSMIDDEALPYQKDLADSAIASGKAVIDSLKDLQDSPACNYKRRVSWISSLISSGAMPGWKSATYDSADGWQADIYKADDSGDGQVFSELDLKRIFKEGHQMDFKHPIWSTQEGSYNYYYPRIAQLCPEGDADPDVERTHSAIENLRPSIVSQLTTAQRRKSWNGSIETRVVLKNRFTDGKEEEKTIVNDASKVLEEVGKQHVSVKQRHCAIGLAITELSFRKQKEAVAVAKAFEDEGVE